MNTKGDLIMSKDFSINVGGAQVHATAGTVKKTHIEGDNIRIELANGGQISYKTQESSASIYIENTTGSTGVVFQGMQGASYSGSPTAQDLVTLDKNCKGCVVNTRNGGPADFVDLGNKKNSIFVKGGDQVSYGGHTDFTYIPTSDATILPE
jgi:hypothetical protein